ncbi:MAG: amidohydrolase [Proteobacteria bacterium]|nr:amidohydrolase [Pseudomonadota bacterium]
MDQATFFDVHCHAITLSHPNFLSFLDAIRVRSSEVIYNQIRSPNFLARALFRSRGETVRNLLAVMENSPGAIFEIMEDDLLGRYAKEGDPEPLVSEGALRMSGRRFGTLALCPLVMDFDGKRRSDTGSYYYRPPEASIEAHVRDVMIGIRDYRRDRPDGLLEIYPFLGVNTENHTPESLHLFLARHFGAWRPGWERARAVFGAMKDYSSNWGSVSGMPGDGCLFSGIKLYPPLGFDPWPEPGEDREKVEILYGFCERRGIPITTHCDDHGFRVVSMKEAFELTAPSRYLPALERFPELRIDFAHFGRQYTTAFRRPPPTEWFEAIVGLIDEYPNVYADISFNGVEPEYYERLVGAIAALPDTTREKVESRVMFGSDFVVSLMKIRSYADYFRIFDASPVAPELQEMICSRNPARFLFGEG